ncbi:MAG: sensor domain-containing protein [Micromonosporaceae bacterium]
MSETTWWRLPFAGDTWRRTGYALAALPVGVIGLALAVVGAVGPATRLQGGLARRLIAVAPRERHRWLGAVGHGLLSLPLNLVVAAVTLYAWSLVPTNLGFPLRIEAGESLEGSWGGPTLAGAWAVHAAGGLVFLFVNPWLVRGLTALQGGLLRRLL